jgi:hypothetical protein
VWCLLVLELIFEIIIRPKGYADLIESDRAFAPSTARHINQFHMFFEVIALVTFLPEFQCIDPNKTCRQNSVFSSVGSSLDAIIGETHAISARGRFLMGLTVLRLFGLIRHWKQMFINNTFRPTKREGIEKWLISPGKGTGDSMSTRKRSSKRNEVCNIFLCNSQSSTVYSLIATSG